MTAYVQPGDKIHIAFGIPTTLLASKIMEYNDRMHQEYVDMYASIGVMVEFSTGVQNSNMAAPVIISVLRAPKEVSDVRTTTL